MYVVATGIVIVTCIVVINVVVVAVTVVRVVASAYRPSGVVDSSASISVGLASVL